MVRRAGPSLLLLALGLASGVLVARLPPDLETTVVTRRHHGADPLLSAVLLRFGVDSLLHHPSRYFQPPIFFPDPNPLRGTEPLVAEALLAVPFRLALGDRPAAVFTWVKIVTPGEITRPEGLLLVAPGDGAVSAVELDYGRGRFGRVPSSLRVLGLVGDEWLDVTEEPTGDHLRARAANQLLTQRTARLVVRLWPGLVQRLRLVSADVPWDLPEVRVRVSAGGLTAPR